MGKDTVIVLRDGTQLKLTPKALRFIEELKKFRFLKRDLKVLKLSIIEEDL